MRCRPLPSKAAAHAFHCLRHLSQYDVRTMPANIRRMEKTVMINRIHHRGSCLQSSRSLWPECWFSLIDNVLDIVVVVSLIGPSTFISHVANKESHIRWNVSVPQTKSGTWLGYFGLVWFFIAGSTRFLAKAVDSWVHGGVGGGGTWKKMQKKKRNGRFVARFVRLYHRSRSSDGLQHAKNVLCSSAVVVVVVVVVVVAVVAVFLLVCCVFFSMEQALSVEHTAWWREREREREREKERKREKHGEQTNPQKPSRRSPILRKKWFSVCVCVCGGCSLCRSNAKRMLFVQ